MASISNDGDDKSILSNESARFLLPQVGDSEEVEMYRKGGFHPAHLGDLYDDSRYRIVHKLGAGGYSVVWLARDLSLNNWVALKIMVADKSSSFEDKAVMCHNITSEWNDGRFVTYTRYFHIEGPNGRHLCLLLPLLGPSSYILSHFRKSRIRPWLARRVAFQATQALADLHSRGLCHGGKLQDTLSFISKYTNSFLDLTPSNIVFRIRNIDHLDDQGIYGLFGEPRIDTLETESGESSGPEAPRYIVGYPDFMSSGEDLLLDEICLIDFDQAFLSSTPPEKTLGTPPGFLAPEVAVGKPASPASDVRALVCTILHIRAGSSPFSIFGVDCPLELMVFIIRYLGDIPKSWGELLFDKYGLPTANKALGNPLTNSMMEDSLEQKTVRQWISEIWDEPTNDERIQPPSPPGSPSELIYRMENIPYPSCYFNRLWKPAAIKIDDMYLDGYCEGIDAIVASLPKISAHEVDLLFDLASKIFVYEPSQRLSASDLLAHPWFQLESPLLQEANNDDMGLVEDCRSISPTRDGGLAQRSLAQVSTEL